MTHPFTPPETTAPGAPTGPAAPGGASTHLRAAISALAAGHSDALGLLYDHAAPWLWALACRACDSEAEARSAMIAAFETLQRDAAELEHPATEAEAESLLRVVLRHAVLNQRREIPGPAGDKGPPRPMRLPAVPILPDEGVDPALLKAEGQARLALFDPFTQSLLARAYLDGETYESLGRSEGQRPGALRAQLGALLVQGTARAEATEGAGGAQSA